MLGQAVCAHLHKQVTGTAAHSFEWATVPMRNVGKEVPNSFLRT